MVTTSAAALHATEGASGRVGLKVGRYFTSQGAHPYDELEWELRDAVITDHKTGAIAFEQRDVEFPVGWSMNATTIVAQKYFRGQLGTPQRERSVKHMIDRVADTITDWGGADGYFADEDSAVAFNHELKHLLVHQKAAFNSPVWFNVGVEPTPQCSACQPWDALVATPVGFMPIGAIVDRDLVGLEVLDATGTTTVEAVKYNGRKPVLRALLRNGMFVEATEDHVVWATGERRTAGAWRRMDELRPGMRLHLQPHRSVASGDAADRREVSEAALAGWLQADGFVGQYESGTNRSLTIEFQIADDDEYAWIKQHLDVVLPHVHRKERQVEGIPGFRRVRLYGEDLRGFVESWGLMARRQDMRVPERLWTAHDEVVAAYLRSVWQADGYVTLQGGSGRVGFGVVSERWTEDLQVLLLRLGIYSRRYRKHEVRPNRSDLWVIDVSYLSERQRFADQVGFIGFGKQEKLEATLALPGKECPDIREEEVLEVLPVGEMDVYDIQTASGEYLSNNLRIHNCFILKVEDTMSSILNWYVEEGTIFKGGSGSGVNLSRIRSSREHLKGGGEASGPVSFMRGADASAGTIKSGGKTRRAAKMVILNVDHPDIEEFIWCKQREELKARALREAGFDMDLDGLDSGSIQYQNANNSVRVTDEFMQAVLSDRDFQLVGVTDGEVKRTLPARKLMRDIAQAAWECADPGMQYDTTINDWHTTPNAGRINGSNPCCFTGETLVETAHGPERFDLLEKTARAGEELPEVRAFDRDTRRHVLRRVKHVWVAGHTTELVDVTTGSGLSLRCTPEHRFLLRDGAYVEAHELRRGDALRALDSNAGDREDFVADVRLVHSSEPVAVYDMEVEGTHNFAVTTDGLSDGAVVVSNSEYMHLDNSACNLASLNLRKFEAGGVFDVEAFKRAVEIVFTAQEIIVGNSSYPTDAIAANAKAYRQLGLGYANLGGLLMSQGLAYDSEEGRAWASAITALMTGHAYRTSAELARVQGPFDGYAADREGTLRVLRKHQAAADDIDASLAPGNILEAAKQSWADAVRIGTEHGVRNAQATVLAPTGCLVGGTLVPTERGLVRLSSLGDPAGPQWQDLGVDVVTDEGTRRATQFYVNGLESVVTVDTARGYRIQGTPRHRVKVVLPDGSWEWKRFADVGEGDRVPLALDQLVGEPQVVALPPLGEGYWTGERHVVAPETISPQLAELVGYFMGDGSLHARGLRLCVAADDLDVVERLRILGKELFNIEARTSKKTGYTEVALHSVRLAQWWQACGFAKYAPHPGHTGKGWLPHVPDAVLHANDRRVYGAFVRGLFEADGTVTAGYPNWSTTSLDFSLDVQSLLLALGYPTTRKTDRSGWGRSELAVLRLLNRSYSECWLDEIGFMSDRKNAAVEISDGRQAARRDHIPVTRELIDRVAPDNGRLRRVLLLAHSRHGAVSRRSATEAFEASGDRELGQLLRFFYDTVASAQLGDDELTYDLSVPDNVTYLANGFVSHNTIGLMMDCDTTGIEPDLGLVKMKKLVGGGSMKIVNRTVPAALAKLGYQPEQVEAIIAYIDEHATIEGAPAFDPAHLPVFDCAMGDRSISALGHVQMMAAVQPWISGAISKTVNLPESATVEDVEEMYIEGWKLRLKAIAIYRDNCKVAQPLSIDKRKKQAQPAATDEQAGMIRRRLPKQRPSQTFSFQVGDAEGYLTAGEYPGDGIGEIFVKLGKQGSTLSGVMDAFAIAVSLGLQYGVPLEAYVKKFTNMRFEPAGMTDDPEVKFASSILDYIFRRLAIEYLPAEERHELGIYTLEERNAQLDATYGAAATSGPPPLLDDEPVVDVEGQQVLPIERAKPVDDTYGDAPMCFTCGVKMQRAGSCHVCPSCGTTSGCS